MYKNLIQFACLLVIVITAVSLTCPVRLSMAQADGSYWAPVQKAFGIQGDTSKDGVITFTIPRNLTVMLDGVSLAPGSDMAHEFNFMRAGNDSMMVGEIMLKEDEVAGVTKKLRAAGIEESALHNHLLRETPRIMWLHVHGHGDPVQLAIALRNITDSLSKSSVPAMPAQPVSQLPTSELDRILGSNGTAEDGVYVFNIPRADAISMNGMALLPEMDVSTHISFQPLGGGKAAAIGEFVLEADEVDPVLGALADNGVEVTALHSHMITEQPRLFYLHCWAKGDSTQIANAMRKALDKTNRSFAA